MSLTFRIWQMGLLLLGTQGCTQNLQSFKAPVSEQLLTSHSPILTGQISNADGRSLCLTAPASPGPVSALECAGGSDDTQTWNFDPITGSIKNKNGLCLDLRSGANVESQKNGDLAVLYECYSGPHQKWSWSGSGFLRTAKGLCLDLSTLDPGGKPLVWDCYGGPHQSWTLSQKVLAPVTLGQITPIPGQFPQPSADAQFLVVSPNGSDSGDGTLAAPLRSLNGARLKANLLRAKRDSDVAIVLRGGIYPVSSPVEFGENDTSPSGKRTFILAYRAEEPVLTGAVQISQWSPAGFTPGGIAKYSANAKGARFRQLYIEGHSAQRGRWPTNAGTIPAHTLADLPDSAEFRLRAEDIPALIQPWYSGEDVELRRTEIVLAKAYTMDKLRLDRFDAVRNQLFIQAPDSALEFCVSLKAAQYSCNVSDRPNGPGFGNLASGLEEFWFENHPKFLAKPGDWYLSVVSNTVTVVAPLGVQSAADMNRLKVLVPGGTAEGQNETLLRFLPRAKNVVVNGLRFENTNWLKPDFSGTVVLGAGFFTKIEDGKFVNTPAPAAVEMSYVENIYFSNNTFTRLGANGATASNSTRVAFLNNIFVAIADSALVAVGNSFFRVEANFFRSIGLESGTGSAVTSSFVNDGSIKNNDVGFVGGFGISFGGWNSGGLRSEIVENRIDQASMNAYDSGAIYTNTLAPGSELQINKNWISGSRMPAWIALPNIQNWLPAGIYFDFDSYDVWATNNKIEGFGRGFTINLSEGVPAKVFNNHVAPSVGILAAGSPLSLIDPVYNNAAYDANAVWNQYGIAVGLPASDFRKRVLGY